MRRARGVFAGLLFIFFFLSPSAVFAADCQPGEVPLDFGNFCVPTDPIGFVAKFYGLGLGLIGFVAILFMIIGGYYIMMSRGNLEMLARGKSFIFYSIAGLLLAILGFVFIEIVTGQILKIPGFS